MSTSTYQFSDDEENYISANQDSGLSGQDVRLAVELLGNIREALDINRHLTFEGNRTASRARLSYYIDGYIEMVYDAADDENNMGSELYLHILKKFLFDKIPERLENIHNNLDDIKRLRIEGRNIDTFDNTEWRGKILYLANTKSCLDLFHRVFIMTQGSDRLENLQNWEEIKGAYTDLVAKIQYIQTSYYETPTTAVVGGTRKTRKSKRRPGKSGKSNKSKKGKKGKKGKKSIGRKGKDSKKRRNTGKNGKNKKSRKTKKSQ